jgi:hypothetical protein
VLLLRSAPERPVIGPVDPALASNATRTLPPAAGTIAPAAATSVPARAAPVPAATLPAAPSTQVRP